jgi:DNA polymerase III subunit epsilon
LKYAILDIETTGGSPKNEKITEIAIFFHNGEKVVDEYSTLINPEKTIPYFITGLTGITNEMVADAPKFYEIAKKIVELTEDCIIVGHNVNFDYSFIQSEFSQLGYDFHRNTLCTVKLSRKLIPGFKSYSLGKLCEQLSISINGRHRASGDAMATVILFEKLLEISNQSGELIKTDLRPTGRIKNLNAYLKPEQIHEIPAATGVYYLHDTEGNLLYVGKSRNIHARILNHLGNRKNRRATELTDRVAVISYELTGSELIALLKESEEIKSLKPKYNRAQRRTLYAIGLYSFYDDRGYINLRIQKTGTQNSLPLTSFENMQEARRIMGNLIEKHWLCQKLCGMYDTDGACFHHSIRQCNGACIGKESKTVYNERAEKMLGSFRYENENLIIIDKGRTESEKSIISIAKGVYQGFGYLDTGNSYLNVTDILECIKPSRDNRDIRQIIRSWLDRNKVEKVIRY